MQYGTYTKDGMIIRASDNACIPPDPVNRDYQAALAAVAAGDTIAAYVAPTATGADVDAERERRRYMPLAVTVSSATFEINMDATSQNNIQGLSTVGLYLSSAAPTQTVPFRDLANTMHDLLPADMVSMGIQVATHIQALYVASWAIKAIDPIPADYADDSRWT